MGVKEVVEKGGLGGGVGDFEDCGREGVDWEPRAGLWVMRLVFCG